MGENAAMQSGMYHNYLCPTLLKLTIKCVIQVSIVCLSAVQFLYWTLERANQVRQSSSSELPIGKNIHRLNKRGSIIRTG